MTDQTNRYARRTIKVAGLLRGDPLPEAPFTLEASGIRWNLFGKNEAPEIIEVTTTTRFINGSEIPTSLTAGELAWVMQVAQENGLDYAEASETKKQVSFSIPYMDSPVLFPEDFAAFPLDTVEATVTMGKGNGTLTILLEADSGDALADPAVDAWTTERIGHVRRALQNAGFTEEDLSIDCEVILGAERITACDPAMMKTMLKEEEEE
tara:strand:- start:473 stop:1099 length:627 start_codon:yes stop_codon:yes gene_type:complete